MAAEAEAAARKTFRLDTDVQKIISERQRQFGTENGTINGLIRGLVKMEKKAANDEVFYASQQQKITDANEVAKQWKEKFDAKCAELQQLQSALALVGKFMRPVDL